MHAATANRADRPDRPCNRLRRTSPALAIAAVLLTQLPSAGTVSAQARHELDVRIETSIKKAAEFLWTKQETNSVLLFQKIFSGDEQVIKVDGVKWGDVVIVPKSTTVRIKGRTYENIECVIPPGWFAPEPPMGDLPKNPATKEGYGNVNPWYGGTTCLVTQALLATRYFHPVKDPRMKMAVECCLNIHMLDPGGQGSKTAPPTKAGADPKTDKPPRQLVPGIQSTYVLGLHGPALELAKRRGAAPASVGPLMAALTEDYRRLSMGYKDDDGWKYMPALPGNPSLGIWRWDLSNTQYGILALWAAARAGVEMDEKVWKHLNKLLLDFQHRNGGWGYSETHEPEPTPTMTTAGIASLFVILDLYWTRTRGANAPDITPFTNTPMLIKTLQSIERGLEHFGRIYQPIPDAYFLYGVERIGAASGLKYFGTHDWFREGVEMLLGSQTAAGEYRLPRNNRGSTITTALALLFIVHGRGPILINKLRYSAKNARGDKDEWQWMNYPRDCANLTRWYDDRFEIEALWQVVTLQRDKEEDLLDAPVLYVNGYEAMDFTAEETDILRRYLERGGTMLLVAAGGKTGGKRFLDSAGELARKMYPAERHPEMRLTALPKDHPVATGLDGVTSGTGATARPKSALRTEVWHLHNGHRSIMFVVPADIAYLWQGNRRNVGEEAYNVFSHVRSYATDREVQQDRFRAPVTAGITPAPARGEVKVGVVKYNSRGKVNVETVPGSNKREQVPTAGDWTAAGSAWEVYAPWFKAATGVEIKEFRGISLADPRILEQDVLHLAGHYSAAFSTVEMDNLKKFVESGGTLLVEAVGGHDIEGGREFVPSVRNMLRDLFAGKSPENFGAGDPLLAGKFTDPGGATGFDVQTVSFSRKVTLNNPNQRTPMLQGIQLKAGERQAVIISPLDLSGGIAGISYYDRDGYSVKSARELTANILLSARAAKRAGK